MLGNNFSKTLFSFRFIDQRRHAGYPSQEALARKLLGITTPSNKLSDEEYNRIKSKRRTISNWESGRATPSLTEFVTLCDILDCDPEYLLGACPTPRKETKNIMDLTGLSENTADRLLDIKKEVDVLGSKSPSADFIEGLDVLFRNSDSFMQCLSEISRLNHLVEEYGNTKEALATYEPDEFFEWPECDEMYMSLVDIYRKNVNDVRLTTYHCTAAFSYIVRDLSKNVPIDSKL